MAEPLLLGVRHHGPGSARAVRRALSAFQPEAILIEGPPEADSLVSLAGDEAMRAPVALLAYAADAKDPKSRAAFWPFAEFSPEWQAIRWAVAHEVPVRFIDLPASVRFGIGEPRATKPKAGDANPATPETVAPEGGSLEAASPGAEMAEQAEAVRTDPIGVLAEAAGYDDPERWWEDVVEHRFGLPDDEDELKAATAPFTAIAEAMIEVRSTAPPPPEAERIDEERREA